MENDRKVIVSIIIPVYQAKDTLERCVTSCLDQQNIEPGDMEIILVDDGSTDGSADLCDRLSLADEHRRITVIHTENQGVSCARNTGINVAKGRFVAFADSDDYVKANLINNMLKHADEATAVVDETTSYEGNQKISGFQYIEDAILNSNTHVWGKLFDRETLSQGNIRFPEKVTIGEDLLFLLDLAIYLDKRRCIKCIADGDYVYTENENSAMNKAFKESYLDQIFCWRQAEEKLLKIKDKISYYAFVSVAASQIMTALLVAGKVATQGSGRNAETDKKAIKQVKDQISHALKIRGAYAALSFGYKLKVLVFRISPDLYIKLYARHKS